MIITEIGININCHLMLSKKYQSKLESFIRVSTRMKYEHTLFDFCRNVPNDMQLGVDL